jgi:ribosome-associated heat shock protein Hsp15
MTDASRKIRLDVWLDIACLFRTRSEAQKSCQRGRVQVNGHRAKPHREIKAGDEVLLQRPLGRKQQVIVRDIAEKHVPKAEARLLYEDVTPPPSPEELELRRLAALARPHRLASRAPERRERRALRDAKERPCGEDG